MKPLIHIARLFFFQILILIVVMMLSLFVFCQLPTDPNNPTNSDVHLMLKTTTGKPSNEIYDSLGKDISVIVAFNYPEFIKSTTLEILSPTGAVNFDTVINPLSNAYMDTVTFTKKLLWPKKNKFVVTSYVNNGAIKKDSASVLVFYEENRQPEFSIEGNLTITPDQTCSLRVIVSDPDKDQKHTIVAKNGEVSNVLESNLYIWKPTDGFTGTKDIIFQVTDNGNPSLSKEQKVTITVLGNAPHWDIQDTMIVKLSAGLTYTLKLLDTCTDARDSNLAFTLLPGKPDNDTIDNGIYKFASTESDTSKYYVTIIAKNKFGLSDTLFLQLVLMYIPAIKDTIPPLLRRYYPLTDSISVSASEVAIKVVCKDSYGIGSVTGTLDTNQFTATKTDDTLYTIFISKLPEKNYSMITITATDKSSNSSTIKIFIKYDPSMKDNTKPILTPVNPLNTNIKTANTSINIQITCKDGSGIQSVVCQKNGTNVETTKKDTLYSATISGLVSGKTDSVRFIAVDNSPAQNSDTLLYLIKCDQTLDDSTGPEIKLISPSKDNDTVGSPSLNIKILCKDSSGISSVACSSGATSFPVSKDTGDVYSALVTGLQSGKNVITFTVTDSSVNFNKTIQKITIYYDPAVGKPIIQNSKKIVMEGIPYIDSSITLSISAIGTSPLVYSWHKTGASNVFSNTSTFTIKKLSKEHTGDYYCIVSNMSGSDTSQPYTLALLNRKPALNEIDTIRFNEDQTGTIQINIPVTDPDGDTIRWKILSKPKKGDLNIDSGIISTTKTEMTYLVKADSNGMDSFRFSYSDGKIMDSALVYIRITAVNDKPEFINPDTIKQIDENIISTITFKAKDKDGDIPILSLVPTSGIPVPPWITSVGSAETITLTLSPDFNIATTSSPSVLNIITLKVTDGKDSTLLKIRITVNNTNRAPRFTNFASTVESIIGDTTNVKLSGNDPDGDTPSFSVVNSFTSMTVLNGYLKWVTPRETFTPGMSRTVKIRVSDHSEYSDSTFTVSFLPHKWNLISQSSEPEAQYAAANANTIFRLTSNAPDGLVSKSIDGGETWIDFLTLSQIHVTQKRIIQARGAALYIFWTQIGNTTYNLSAYNFASGNSLMQKSFNINKPSVKISPDGKTVLGFQYYFGSNYMYYITGGIDTTISINHGFWPYSVGNTYFWGANSTALYHTSQIKLNDSLGGFEKSSGYLTDNDAITNDGNNGDTIFLYDTILNRIDIKTNNNNANRNNTIPAKKIEMINGNVGWALTTNGEIYFTNNAFLNIYKETMKTTINGLKITEIFSAADGITMFAYGTDDAGVVYLFRY